MICLRPHHGLCIQHFKGKGYSKEFVYNMTKIINNLDSNPSQKILLQCKSDNICNFCPNNEVNNCKDKDKVLVFDKKCLELCHLSDGDIIAWGDYKNIVFENIISKKLIQFVCSDCEWNTICSK